MDERPAKLCRACREELLDEVLFDREVLVEELGQQPLVDVIPHAHQRELEEPRHRRRQHVELLVALLEIEENGLRRQRVENALRFGQRHLPGGGGTRRRERADRQLRHQFGFALGEEQAENAVEEVRRRRTLGKLVQPVDEVGVRGPGGEVRHDGCHCRRSMPASASGDQTAGWVRPGSDPKDGQAFGVPLTDCWLNTFMARAIIEPMSPIFAGSTRFVVPCTSWPNWATYCSATRSRTAS